MARFADLDTHGYRMVDVRTGYRKWMPTYEQSVQNMMDLALLDELGTPVAGRPQRRALATTSAPGSTARRCRTR